MAEYTDQERDTIRTAAYGAMALVSKADPGFFAMFKESMAGSKALAAAPPQIQSLLKEGGMPQPPQGKSAEEVETSVLGNLTQAMTILKGKDPEQVEGFKNVILAACQAVADASKGVSPEEQAMIERVKGALA
ncbi:MAG: hypothetical protein LWW86_03945 [Micrococcales bacterium]|nr:hypothetical protein [Micrococcales bacterium]